MNNSNHAMAVQAHPTNTSLKRPLKLIGVGFMVVVLLMVFLVSFGLSRLHISNQQLEEIVNVHNKQAELAHKFQLAARERVILLHAIVAVEDMFERDVLVQRFDALPRRIATAMDELQGNKLDDQEKAFLAKVRQRIALNFPLQQSVLDLALDGKSSEAQKLLLEKVMPSQDKTLDMLEQFANLQFKHINLAAASAKSNYQQAVNYMVTSGVVAIVLSVLIALFVNRRMSGLMMSLQAKEQEARVLLDNIPDLVWLKNPESRYVWANSQFEQATGIDQSQMVGLSDQEVWQANESAGCQSDDRKAMEVGATIQNEKSLTNHAGVSRKYATSLTPIFDATGQCMGVLGLAHDVTERNQMAEEIREANFELHFQKAALDQHAIVSIADVHGNITYVNDKFCEISKYRRDELLGQNHRVLKSSYHPPEFFDDMWVTIAAGQVWQGEVCNRAKGDDLYWVKTTIVPFLDENGLPQRYVSIRTDITRAKEAEQLLLRSREELEGLVQERTGELMEAKRALEADVEARRLAEESLNQFKTTLDQTHDSVFMFSPDTLKFFYVNRGAAEQVGYSIEELLQMTSVDIKPEFTPESFRQILQPLLSGQQSVMTFETVHQHKDGHRIPVEILLQYIHPAGADARFIAIVRDITERKRVEQALNEGAQALHEQLHFTRELMEVLPNPLFYKEVDGVYLGVNKAWESFFGRNRMDIIGQTVSDLYTTQPEVATKHQEMDRQLFAHGGSQSYEISLAGSDGEMRHVVYYKATYTRSDGSIAGLVGTIVDISESKKAEASIRQRNLELNELNQKFQETQNQLLQSEKMASVGQLAAGVAHEINNPIGYVYSNLGTLEKYVKDVFGMVDVYEQTEPLIADAEALALLQAAKKKFDLEFLKEDVSALMAESKDGITRVKKIVQDLKDFSHVDTSEEWHWTNLIKGIDSTLNIVSNEIKYKAQIVKEYQDIPDVECLAPQLNQVFMNLLVNAAHAIEERGTITIRTGTHGEEVWVEVADTGKGIAEENLKRIFDPFFTTKPIGKGTGLGLSLSYGIIQKHHGRIEVQSEVDKGTTFRVCLPISRAESDDHEKT